MIISDIWNYFSKQEKGELPGKTVTGLAGSKGF
jgi:hypothetical protein